MPAPGARPHALYVALGFPPSRGSGVFRALATAHGLLAAGFDVTVLTVDRDFFFRYTGGDEALERLVDPRLHIVRVPLELPAQEWDLRRWSRRRVYSPTAWLEDRLARSSKVFPERSYDAWAEPLAAAALTVHAERPVDVTVATVNPNVDAYAAYRLKQERGVPFVVDQRDAWTLMQFTGERTHAADSPQAQWEGRIFEAADEVWFVNDAMREWHAAAYPAAADHLRVVRNGWDPESISPAPVRQVRQPLTFGFIGTLTSQVPLQEFLDGWHRALDDPSMAGAVASIRGHLGFYRAPNEALARQLEAAAADGVVYGGAVAKPDIAGVYAGMDVLLMLTGGGRYVTTGKVFEYVATGLPVVSVVPPDNGCEEVLRGYPLWFPAASLDADDVADALRRAARGALEAGPEVRAACVEHAQQFRRDRQLGPALDAVRRMAGVVGAAS
jgi:glycosyltransferase involved in cell wall biosynthesis